MLFWYFPLTDTEIEMGKDSKYNILYSGLGCPRGITLRTCREHAEIIIPTDQEYFRTQGQWPRLLGTHYGYPELASSMMHH